MPKIKPLLPSERMRNKFYAKLKSRAAELEVYLDKDIAERLGLSAQNYTHRKKKKDLSSWSIDDLAIIAKKFRFTGDDIAEILAEGMKV